MNAIEWSQKTARHFLSRTSFGATSEQSQLLAASGSIAVAVDRLLSEAKSASPPAPPEWVQEPWINTERVYLSTTEEERRVNHIDTSARYNRERSDLRCWWLGEMIRSAVPFREVMTLFWHGHFTTESKRMNLSQPLYTQNRAMRQHCLGKFRDLLGAVVLDAAMFMYLNIEDSNAKSPNENFARELLELFTVGIGNYQERDIKEIARALTGWTLDAPPGTEKQPTVPDTTRSFCRDGLIPVFDRSSHDPGVKEVLGKSGAFKLEDILDIVAAHSATARFLSLKLIAFFGVADVKGSLLARMERVFAESLGDLTEVMRELLVSDEFLSSASQGNQIKSPVQLLVGACRQLNLDVTPTPSLAQLTAAMGQELFNPPNVKGWPGGRDWVSAGTMAVRYHLPEALFDGREPDGFEPIAADRTFALSPDASERQAALQRSLDFQAQRREERRRDGIQIRFDARRTGILSVADDVESLVNSVVDRLVITELRPLTRSHLIDAVRATPPEERLKQACRIVIMTPEYQLA